MKKATRTNPAKTDMRAEYEIPWDKVVRGKYAGKTRRETYLVPIDPELRKVFPDANTINRALRALAGFIQGEIKVRSHRKSA